MALSNVNDFFESLEHHDYFQKMNKKLKVLFEKFIVDINPYYAHLKVFVSGAISEDCPHFIISIKKPGFFFNKKEMVVDISGYPTKEMFWTIITSRNKEMLAVVQSKKEELRKQLKRILGRNIGIEIYS